MLTRTTGDSSGQIEPALMSVFLTVNALFSDCWPIHQCICRKKYKKLESVPYFPLLELPTIAYLIKKVAQTTIK